MGGGMCDITTGHLSATFNNAVSLCSLCVPQFRCRGHSRGIRLGMWQKSECRELSCHVLGSEMWWSGAAPNPPPLNYLPPRGAISLHPRIQCLSACEDYSVKFNELVFGRKGCILFLIISSRVFTIRKASFRTDVFGCSRNIMLGRVLSLRWGSSIYRVRSETSYGYV